jgi:hypothetical protein
MQRFIIWPVEQNTKYHIATAPMPRCADAEASAQWQHEPKREDRGGEGKQGRKGSSDEGKGKCKGKGRTQFAVFREHTQQPRAGERQLGLTLFRRAD